MRHAPDSTSLWVEIIKQTGHARAFFSSFFTSNTIRPTQIHPSLKGDSHWGTNGIHWVIQIQWQPKPPDRPFSCYHNKYACPRQGTLRGRITFFYWGNFTWYELNLALKRREGTRRVDWYVREAMWSIYIAIKWEALKPCRGGAF